MDLNAFISTNWQPKVDHIKEVYEIDSIENKMGLAVFQSKYSRVKSKNEDGTFNYQSWEERTTDLIRGNFSLALETTDPEELELLYNNLEDNELQVLDEGKNIFKDYLTALRLARKGVMAFSGRHLQHGDLGQNKKDLELFSNCSTAMFSSHLFYLLLKGSGVGRDYSNDICFVDWNNMPNCRFVLEGPNMMGEGGHPDYEPWIESLQDAQHKYDSNSEHVRWFEVEDSAEGWVKMVSILETAAFHKNNKDGLFIFDFSKVRGKGAPIMGQQGRPASGPVPLIKAMNQVASVKGAGFKPWKQALFIDHYLAACVVVGGIRRCLPSFYSVNTVEGWKKITELTTSDKVILPEGSFRILDVIDNGVQHTLKIKTPFGEHVCTPEHRWLVLDTNDNSVKWVEAKSLTVSHKFLKPRG